MGAYKELITQVMDNTYQISKMLNKASEDADIDELKTALRSAIANSALTLAFIAEIEA
jgi:hypothetical protein